MRGFFGPLAVAPLIALSSQTAAATPTESRAAAGPAPVGEITPAKTEGATEAEASAGTPNIAELDAILGAEASACASGPRFESRQRVWVGCGSSGLLVLDRHENGWVVSGRQPTTGTVVGFFEHGGKVWVRLVQERAEAVGESEGGVERLPAQAPTPAPDGAPHSSPSAPPRPPPGVAEPRDVVALSGEIVQLDALDALVNLGEADGVSVGSRIAVDTSDAQGGKRTIVGRVIEVEPNRAKVRLGMNESAKVGDRVSLTEDPVTASRVAPVRAIDHWSLRGMIRPMLNLGEVGGGLLAEFDAGYRTKHFHYGANLWPLALAGGTGEATLTTWSAFAYAGFDSWVFAAGLGLGAQAVNDTDYKTDEGSGLALVQYLRLGAVDGLHLSARARAVVFHSVTEFSALEMQGQIAVAADAWLIFRGGGGSMGFGYGEVAVRNLLQGNGQKGSLFLEVSIGGAGLFRASCPEGAFISADEDCSSHAVGGPIAGIGAEWRL